MHRVRIMVLVGLFSILALQSAIPRVSAFEATPVSSDIGAAEGGSFQSRFFDLAASMPDWSERDQLSIHFADIASRAEAIGVADVEDGRIDIRVATGAALPSGFVQSSLFPLIGFTSTQVERTLFLDAVSEKLTLLQGDFDQEAMRAAMLEQGYTEETIGDVPVFVLGGDDHFDLTTDIGALAFAGKFQYVALLSDDLVGFANTRAGVEAIEAAHAGQAPTLAENADFQDLVASAPVDLFSAQIFSAGILGTPGEAWEDAQQQLPSEVIEEETSALADVTEEFGEMPTFAWILLGDSVGSGWSEGSGNVQILDGASSVMVLAFDEPDQAASALAIVPVRLTALSSSLTGAPYTDLVTLTTAELGVTVTQATFTFDVPIAGRLARMWMALDMRFVYPS